MVQLKRIAAYFDELNDLEVTQDDYNDPDTPKGSHGEDKEVYQEAPMSQK